MSNKKPFKFSLTMDSDGEYIHAVMDSDINGKKYHIEGSIPDVETTGIFDMSALASLLQAATTTKHTYMSQDEIERLMRGES